MNQMAMNGGNMPNGVVGGMAGMNNGANGVTPNQPADDNDYKTKLNTYIYDYLLRNDQFDCARLLLNSGMKLNTKPSNKKRQGMDNDNMDTDSKDDLDMKKPADLPSPAQIIEAATENSFLLDWFTLFWEIFLAPRGKRPLNLNPSAVQYAGHIREQSKLRQEAQSQFLRAPNMAPNMQQYNLMRGMQNPAIAQRMQQGIPNGQQQFSNQQRMIAQRHMMHQNQMERGGSDMDMNGQRPRTPGAMMQGMDNLTEFYAANGAMRPGMAQTPGGAGGNHALQDYQMQLMLLEQQNKKRLLMARQEQDNMRPDAANMGGQQAFTAPGMSPQGSRSGPPGPGQGMMNPQGGPMQQQQQPGQPPQPQQQQQPPQQPPQQGQPQGQPPPNQQGQGQMGTPQPRNAMPPPQGVPGGANAANARPASPAASAASTTPQQSNKANPKKKDAKETRKRPSKKASAAAATPSADGDQPPTPQQPQTPITPMNNKSFDQKAGQQPNTNAGAPPAAAPVQPVAQPQPDPNAMMTQFGDMDPNIASDVNMDFGEMDAGDVLTTFDFDAFLQDDNANPDFDMAAFSNYDGLEASGET